MNEWRKLTRKHTVNEATVKKIYSFCNLDLNNAKNGCEHQTMISSHFDPHNDIFQ